MAVSVKENFPAKLWGLIARGMALQKLTEEKRLASQPSSPCIRGKQIAQLIAKNGGATRFQDDNRDACINVRAQSTHDSLQIFFGPVEHAEIVQGPAAAQMDLRDSNLETRALKHFDRRAARVWMKVIVKRVG